MIKNNFIEEIGILCNERNIEYIDAIVLWCQKNNLEVEVAAYWIKKDPSMKMKVQAEAENLNILKRGARLPL